MVDLIFLNIAFPKAPEGRIVMAIVSYWQFSKCQCNGCIEGKWGLIMAACYCTLQQIDCDGGMTVFASLLRKALHLPSSTRLPLFSPQADQIMYLSFLNSCCLLTNKNMAPRFQRFSVRWGAEETAGCKAAQIFRYLWSYCFLVLCTNIRIVLHGILMSLIKDSLLFTWLWIL